MAITHVFDLGCTAIVIGFLKFFLQFHPVSNFLELKHTNEN